jgi:hypothetical protein
MKGITLEDVRVLDQANENYWCPEDRTLVPEYTAILVQAELIFAGSGFGALATVQIRIEEHRIVLSGALSSFFLMQIAQELVRPILDQRNLVNMCSVVDRHGR